MKKPATRARSGSSVTTVPSTSGRSRRVRPASWAAIMTAVRVAVAMTPTSAHPAQSISMPNEVVCLGAQGGEHLPEGLPEAGHALVLQGPPDVVHVDGDGGETTQRLVGLIHIPVDRA